MVVLNVLAKKDLLQDLLDIVKMLMNVLNMVINVLSDVTTSLVHTDVFALMDTNWHQMEGTVLTSMNVNQKPMIADMIVNDLKGTLLEEYL